MKRTVIFSENQNKPIKRGRPRRPLGYIRRCVTITAETDARITLEAERMGISRSEFVESCVLEFLDDRRRRRSDDSAIKKLRAIQSILTCGDSSYDDKTTN